jgi:hypothetical protein
LISCCRSMGPVGLGDGAVAANGIVGPNSGSNATVILASCDANGTILQPSRPAAAIDAMFGRWWNPTICPGCPARADWPPSGVVMQTHTSLSALTTSRLLLVIAANKTYHLPPGQLYPPLHRQRAFLHVHRYGAACVNKTDAVESGCLMIWDTDSVPTLGLHTGGIEQDQSGHGDFYPWSLLTLYECEQQHWCILGDLRKYVSLSPTRVTKVDAASFCLQGSAREERVTISAISPLGILHTILVTLDTWVTNQAAWTACASFAD